MARQLGPFLGTRAWVGKVNPKHFAFAFDDESKKYDLAELLKDH